jgi:hypothetical protein
VNGPLLIPKDIGPGQNGGLLGRAFEPVLVRDVTDPAGAFGDLEPFPELTTQRLRDREGLLQSLDNAVQSVGADQPTLNKQAFGLLASVQGRRAFDLESEPERIRDRYGRYRAGQACLLARRLVEVGVPFVTVFFNHSIRGQDTSPDITDEYGWDTHNDIFEAMREHLLPRFDYSMSALLEDFEQRGLLESTLIVCMGEFGRAPKVAKEATFVGTTPGRKHWAACYSIIAAGAGLPGGTTFGASDRIAAYPTLDPVTPADIAATMYAALGLDPSGHYQDQNGRIFPLTSGQPLMKLWK